MNHAALLALLDARHARAGTWRASLLTVGLVGAALLYGDGVITPAISVPSAVEGLKLDAPQLAHMVVPVSLAIPFGLFLVKQGHRFYRQYFWPGHAGVVRIPAVRNTRATYIRRVAGGSQPSASGFHNLIVTAGR